MLPYAYLSGLLMGGLIGLLGTKTPVQALVAAGIVGVGAFLAAIADAHKALVAADREIADYNRLVDVLNAAFNDYAACRSGLPSDCENPAFTTTPTDS
jgi:hypothetical protein